MLNAVRSAHGLPPLERHPVLDQLAQGHASQMKAERLLGHDVGHGDPERRIQDSGIPVRAAGENVARAGSISRVHRALWASPSHRANMLDPRFHAIGIGVASDPDGTLWAAEIFADLR
jgi:uncharacterized protein YkwD